MLLRLVRIVAVVLLGALAGAWVASLPVAPFVPQTEGGVYSIQQPLFAALPPADWRDTLVLRLAIADLAVQQRRGSIVWLRDGTVYRMPLIALADGQAHRYVIPLGTHAEWRGAVRDLRLQLPQQAGLRIVDVQLFRRTPWALDALLGRALGPYLPEPPSWPNAVRLVAALLSIGLALAWPGARWRRRLGVALALNGTLAGAAAILAQVALLAVLFPIYAPLDEAAAAARSPAYDQPVRINAALVSAAAQLPDGPILVANADPAGYLIYRARYLLYPRRVDAVPRATPVQLRRLLSRSYVGLIDESGDERPPLPGWRRLSDSSTSLSLWGAPNLPAAAPPPQIPSAAALRLAAALGVVMAAGWALAGLAGWRRGERLACAWPLGVGALGWWMFALSAAGAAWAWWSVGLPLLSAAAALIARSWIRHRSNTTAKDAKDAKDRSFARYASPSRSLRLGFCIGTTAKDAKDAKYRSFEQQSPSGSRSGTLWVVLGSRFCGSVEQQSPSGSRSGTLWVVLGSRFYGSVVPWFCGTVILLLAACVTAQALLLPFTDQDTWNIWGLRGRAFYIDGGLARLLTIYRQVEFHHSGYPPAHSLVQTWGYLAMGGISERSIKAIFPIWYAACLATLWLACRRWGSRPAAWGWTLLLASTPLMLDHAALGNADLPLAAALLVGALALCRWLESESRRWLAAAVLGLGAAAWLKLDGLYLGVGMLAAASLARGLLLRRQGHSPWTAAWQGLAALGAFLVIVAPWIVFRQALGLSADTPGLGLLRASGGATLRQGLAVIGEELLFSHNNSAWGLLGGGYGALWIVCAGALAIGWRRLRGDSVLWFLALVLGGGIAFYLAIYALRPFFSIERYLLHLAPIAILAAARATSAAASDRDSFTAR